jgi:enoyl-CoA hydratase/carnithine racemase
MAIIYEKKGNIAYIAINRPEAMNAIDIETSKELSEAWLNFRDDPNLLVAILSGSGEKAFCTGADLKKFIPVITKQTAKEKMDEASYNPGFGGITKNFKIWKPIIAAINGMCLGGGTEIALACDIRIAAENAKFGFTELRWGLIPGAGGTQRLPRLIPLGKALEMLLCGEQIDAQEAYRLGLVNQVVPLSALMGTATKLAERICKMAPLAVRAAKTAVYRGLDLPLDEALALESSYASFLLGTEDAQEGPRAFAEKREANFKSR